MIPLDRLLRPGDTAALAAAYRGPLYELCARWLAEHDEALRDMLDMDRLRQTQGGAQIIRTLLETMQRTAESRGHTI